jgi:hypothetical protein
MELAPFFRYGLPILLVITIGLLGRTRRVGFWGAFVLSIVLTPVGGFIVTLISGPKPIVDESERAKANPPPANEKKKSWFSWAA